MAKIATREKTSRKTVEKASEPKSVAQPLIQTEAVEAPGCAHHWVIASPNGEYSAGTCKVCGKTKRFPNSAEDNLWSRNVPQSRWTGRSDGDPGGY
jgi:hypothetical protein